MRLRMNVQLAALAAFVLTAGSAMADVVVTATEYENQRLVSVDLTTNVVTPICDTSLYGEPDSLVLDPQHRYIYSVPLTNQIRRCDPSVPSDTLLAGGAQISTPEDMILDPTGTILYVSNIGSGTITQTNLSTLVTTTCPTSVPGPEGLAFDSAGHLFVLAGYGLPTSGIYQIDPTTCAVIQQNTGFDAPANQLDGLTFDPSTNRLFATSSGQGGSNAIYSIDPVTVGLPAVKIATLTSPDGTPSPDGIINDTHGTLYVAATFRGGGGPHSCIPAPAAGPCGAVFSVNESTFAFAQLTPVPNIDDLGIVPPVPPTGNKTTTPPGGPQGFTSTVTITITNPNATTLLNVGFTDNLPAGVVVAATPNVVNTTCGGTFNPALVGGVTTNVTYSGGTLVGGTTCTVKFDVTDNNPGTTISTNCVVANSSNGGADPGPFTVASGRCANLTTTQFVPLLPLVNKTFGTPPSQFGTTIALNGTTVMTVTISNTNTASMTAINFIDTLPAGLQVANPPNVVNTTCGGTFAPVPAPGDTSLSYSGGSLGAGPSSCSISLNVTGVTSASAASGPSPSVCPALVLTAGQKENCVTVNGTVSGVPTVSLIANAIVTVTLPPPLPPSIAKSFAAATIQVGGSTTLSFLITNPNPATTLTGITFTDTLPAGLVVSTPPGLVGACDGGAITALAGTNVISLGSPAATLPGGGSCVFSVNVTAISPGAWVNTTSQVTSIEGGPGNTATATLNVPSPPDAYQIHYISNPTVGGAVNLTNAGTLGACMFGPSGCATDVGDICVNVYVFQSDEQLEECCSCLVTPNALVHLSALDLIGNPGNGVTATNGIVVKLIATIPGTGKIPGTQAGPFTGTFCSPAYPFDVTNLAPGMRAWATTLHALTATAPVTYALTEGKFQTETLSPGELTMVTNLCRFIVGNGSGAGICKSCVPSSGALGGSKQ